MRIASLAVSSVFAALLVGGCDQSTVDTSSSNPAPSRTAVAAETGTMEDPPPEAEIDDLPPAEQESIATNAGAEAIPAPAASKGPQPYAQHCAACHGERGDGQGIAATWLFPKPRNFRAGRFRLVSTDNNVPTREDLRAVLDRGMPGSAMPPWAHLSNDDREALVDEIQRLRIEGAREAYVDYLRNDEELSDEEIAAEEVQEEIQGIVDDSTTPGNTTVVPEIGASTDDALAHGRAVYAKFGCISCHGETGRGDGVQEMFDEEKLPTSPRDLTLGIFKGDPAPPSLFRRIAYGMPGTPMPGSPSMTADETVDLIHYIRSLSTEVQREKAILRREAVVAARVDKLPKAEHDNAWADVKAVQLRLAPLWWRTTAAPSLEVQAVHDGESLAIRLSWADGVENRHAALSNAFEDAVAMQLYSGPTEPFLGMGDKTAPVDVWFWDADRQGPPATVESMYPNAVNDVFPFSEGAAASADINRAGARSEDQPAVSLPARDSGNQIVPPGDESGGTALHVGGPGSVTFRLPQSQSVWAHGTWKDGQWVVLLKRPLAVESPAGGVALHPGQTASVAFAVWDGAHRDRNGQKSITIWQELKLER